MNDHMSGGLHAGGQCTHLPGGTRIPHPHLLQGRQAVQLPRAHDVISNRHKLRREHARWRRSMRLCGADMRWMCTRPSSSSPVLGWCDEFNRATILHVLFACESDACRCGWTGPSSSSAASSCTTTRRSTAFCSVWRCCRRRP